MSTYTADAIPRKSNTYYESFIDFYISSLELFRNFFPFQKSTDSAEYVRYLKSLHTNNKSRLIVITLRTLKRYLDMLAGIFSALALTVGLSLYIRLLVVVFIIASFQALYASTYTNFGDEEDQKTYAWLELLGFLATVVEGIFIGQALFGQALLPLYYVGFSYLQAYNNTTFINLVKNYWNSLPIFMKIIAQHTAESICIITTVVSDTFNYFDILFQDNAADTSDKVIGEPSTKNTASPSLYTIVAKNMHFLLVVSGIACIIMMSLPSTFTAYTLLCTTSLILFTISKHYTALGRENTSHMETILRDKLNVAHHMLYLMHKIEKFRSNTYFVCAVAAAIPSTCKSFVVANAYISHNKEHAKQEEDSYIPLSHTI